MELLKRRKWAPVCESRASLANFASLTYAGYMGDVSVYDKIWMRYASSNISLFDATAGTITPGYQALDRLVYPSCQSQPDPDLNDPPTSGGLWVLDYCNPAPVPQVTGPAPTQPCAGRYKMAASPVPLPMLPFLKVDTVGVPKDERGRPLPFQPSQGLDLMGTGVLWDWHQYGTSYVFDPGCELPHLRVTPIS